jgi:4-diphosphocytidyl-2-C-methyl-D-erythritol kinase
VNLAAAPAKVNLALVVGPRRDDGRHEVASVIQPVALFDEIVVEVAQENVVDGFEEDTLVRDALNALAHELGGHYGWHASITKRIPVAAGLGSGSSDAAAALRLANATLPEPVSPERLHALAGSLGADVPFFLEPGPKLAEGDGTELSRLELPTDYAILLFLPECATKASTADVYMAFDGRSGAAGFAERREALFRALGAVRSPRDLASLPPNDLVSSGLPSELEEAGAFRADVTGAGPVLYGLFDDVDAAEAAARELRRRGRVWITQPAW